LAGHLLGIESEKQLGRSSFLGPLFEGFVAAEILKHQLASGRAKALYYFRDQQGLEVDFIVPTGDQRLLLLEAKASRTVVPALAAPLERLAAGISGYQTAKVLVYRDRKEPVPGQALKSGTKALPLSRLGSVL
jgi:predicted AAA+ superfamily ATPase